jgi:hypothetical protein
LLPNLQDLTNRENETPLWSVFAGLISLMVTPLLFIGGPDYSSGPLIRSAWNLGHIALFALVTLAIRPWRFARGWKLWAGVTAGILLLGTAIELIQGMTGRVMDPRDLVRNLLGCWLVLGFQPVLMRSPGRSARTTLMAALVTLLLLVETSTTAQVAMRQFHVHRLLPALYDFQTTGLWAFWNGDVAATTVPAGDGDQAAVAVNLDTGVYSGAFLNNFPGDWRGYDRLIVELYNPSETPLDLTLRIHDLTHDRGRQIYADRFNTQLALDPGNNRFEIDLARIASAPAQRPMDMSEVRRIGLFAARLPEPRTIYLTGLRLE